MYRLLVLLAAVAAVTSRNVNNRVMGGSDTSIDKYPFQAAVIDKNGKNVCGAAILNSKYVITAAHCTYANGQQQKSVRVRVGTSQRTSGGSTSKVARVFNHPSFDLKTLDYDVAVLEVKDPISLSASAAAVELVDADDRRDETDELIATGWGMKDYGDGIHDGGALAEVLQEVRLVVINRAACAEAYKYAGGFHEFTGRMFCAAGGWDRPDKGHFRGDDGCPLLNDAKELVGIHTYGGTYNITRFPGVYIDLTDSEIRSFVDQYANKQ